MIIGQIKYIRLGGLGVELVGIFPPDSIAIGSLIKNMQFILDGKEIFIDGVVVAYQKNFCAFLFKDMTTEIRESISQFAFKKISSIEEEKKLDKKG